MILKEYLQFAQKIGLISITNILITLSGILLLPILTKTLPIAEYGIYVQITVTMVLIPGLVMLGLPYTMIRFLAAAKTREEKQEGFYSIAAVTVITSAIASIVIFILADPIAREIFDGQVEVTQIIALIIFCECINLLQFNYFRTFQLAKHYSVLSIFKTVLQLGIIGTFVLLGYRIYGVAAGLFIADLVLLLLMAGIIVSDIGISVPKFTNLREYLSFGLPTVPGNVSSWILNSSDKFLITLFLGTTFVGYYAPGYFLGNIIIMYVTPLAFMLPAVLSKYYEDNNLQEVQTILKYSLKYFLLFAIPSWVGLSVLSKPLLTILTTPEIAANGYLITPFIGISAIIMGIFTIMFQIFILEKNTMITAKIWIIAALLNFGMNLFLIPFLGIIGAAITTIITFVFALCIVLHYFRAKSGIRITHDFGKTIVRITFASLCMIPVLVLLHPDGILSILFAVTVSTILYFVVLFILGEISAHEVSFFKKILIPG